MKLSYIVILLLVSVNAVAQKTTLTFITDKDCEINIYEPIDGEYNTKIPASKLITHRGQHATYKTNITSYIFVNCQFPQYQKSCTVILFPNDSIQIAVTKDRIKFQGNNTEGHQYFYNHFQKRTHIDNIINMQKVIIEYMEQKRDIHNVLPAMYDSLHFSSYIKQIEELQLTKNVTEEFLKVLQTEIYMFFSANIVDMMQYLLLSTKKYEHIIKDKAHIEKIVKDIYQKLPVRLELLKYNSLLYTLKYFSFYYSDKECPAGYDPETFGPYKMYLYAPENMQPGLLGGACMTQLKYNSGEMSLSKLKKFFNEKFPNSEYTHIINQKVKEETNSNNEISDDSHFINEQIDSLSQLSNLQELKGKYLFIDLWASWCMPCRAEFGYRSKLEELLNTYKNVSIIYISIDRENQEKAWKNCIKYYKLKGYHLRATSALQENIKKEIYKEKPFEIPRYVLIGPKGEILNQDLPRPSEYPQLKEEFNQIPLKNNLPDN